CAADRRAIGGASRAHAGRAGWRTTCARSGLGAPCPRHRGPHSSPHLLKLGKEGPGGLPQLLDLLPRFSIGLDLAAALPDRHGGHVRLPEGERGLENGATALGEEGRGRLRELPVRRCMVEDEGERLLVRLAKLDRDIDLLNVKRRGTRRNEY